MTREQEISMGAHAARTSETGPTTAARIATTTLAVAVTGTVGTGTALAHDDGSAHGGHHEEHGHTERSVDAGSAHGGTAADLARVEAARAQAEARQTVRDALADLGMGDDHSSSPFDGDDSDGDDGGHGDSGDDSGDDSDDAGTHDGGSDGSAPAPQPAATRAPEPSAPSSGTRTTTQPIAASEGARPASNGAPTGPTQTVPIR